MSEHRCNWDSGIELQTVTVSIFFSCRDSKSDFMVNDCWAQARKQGHALQLVTVSG